MKIQERESALIIGTFGRAIWVLDDLLSLRKIAGKLLNSDLTALPTNEAVQVKGLFIAPPGNIWTGFHTTFEGENRVFKKAKVPYYIQSLKDSSLIVTARVYDNSNNLINEVKAKPIAKGLSYLTWKLDEQSYHVPGAWINEESRDIPVLPGNYKIVLNYGASEATTSVNIVADPRFDLDPEIDAQLYEYRKNVDDQVRILAGAFESINKNEEALETLEQKLSSSNVPSHASVLESLKELKDKLANLKAKGRTPRPNRQVGAWQSSEITPYSKLNEAKMIAMSRVRPISDQELGLLEEAKRLVLEFNHQVDSFMEKDWMLFEKLVENENIVW